MGNKLFVGNLSFKITDGDLQNTFAECGTVTSAKVITDRDSGRSKGFGFVEMGSDAEAQAAIQRFNGVEADGRAMTVSIAKPMEPRENRGGGGRGGYGGGGRGRY
ncbi:MAG: RNA-binding protein [Bdellovibrionales bacterium]|nr:RNA-binding protein [Bdellovibrionales bacterium]